MCAELAVQAKNSELMSLVLMEPSPLVAGFAVRFGLPAPKARIQDGPIDTVSRQPAFKVPVNTIDAPDPESVEDESNFGSAQATTPNDILLAAHRTKPLSRAVDAQIPGGEERARSRLLYHLRVPQAPRRVWCPRV